MAEKDLIENETKKKGNFAYQDVEAAVGKMMTPTVKKLLEESYHVDMAEVLPVIHQNNPRAKDDTIEKYAQRCIEVALATQVQKNAVEKIEEKRGKKEERKVDLKGEEPKKEEPEQDIDTDPDGIFKQASEMQKKFVLTMLKAPFKIIAALAEEHKMATIIKDGKTATVVNLDEKESSYMVTQMQKAKASLDKAFEKDGVKVQDSVQGKQDSEVVKAQEEVPDKDNADSKQDAPNDKDTIKLADGKEVTFAEYKAALKSLSEDPKAKKLIEKYGIDIDELANEMFNKIDSSAQKDILECVKNSFEYVIGRKELLEAYNISPGINFAKLSDDDKRKEGIHENRDREAGNELFNCINNICKFPFEAIKTLLTGKTPEELKAEAAKLNLKDVHLELSTQTREVLLKKLDGYESILSNAVVEAKRQQEVEARAEENAKKARAEQKVGVPEVDDETKTKILTKNVEDTTGAGYGNPDGNGLVADMTEQKKLDAMTPEERAEYLARKEAERKEAEKGDNDQEYDIHGKPISGRSH